MVTETKSIEQILQKIQKFEQEDTKSVKPPPLMNRQISISHDGFFLGKTQTEIEEIIKVRSLFFLYHLHL